ncbi:hypothetical protein D3C84_908500 [compost metagenome]
MSNTCHRSVARAKERPGNAIIQAARIIVNVHREQACSHSFLCAPHDSARLSVESIQCLLQPFAAFSDHACHQFGAGRDVVDQADDLAGTDET